MNPLSAVSDHHGRPLNSSPAPHQIVFRVRTAPRHTAIYEVTWYPRDRDAGRVPSQLVIVNPAHSNYQWTQAADVLWQEPEPRQRQPVNQVFAELPGCRLVVRRLVDGQYRLQTLGAVRDLRGCIDPDAGLRCAVLGGYCVLTGQSLRLLTPDAIKHARLTWA